ncbi:hypothetical protein HDU76_010847 [Blyttiomyces sp. JEL0837]|nr:hypothetical protein HDU76_010847 [Blyttiomyces sp. JEL0837]
MSWASIAASSSSSKSTSGSGSGSTNHRQPAIVSSQPAFSSPAPSSSFKSNNMQQPGPGPGQSIKINTQGLSLWIKSKTSLPSNFNSTTHLLQYLSNQSKTKSLPRLEDAIKQFQLKIKSERHLSNSDSFQFERDLLPFILDRAKDFDILEPKEESTSSSTNKQPLSQPPRLETGKSSHLEITASQILSLLSNAFLLNLKTPYDFKLSDKVGSLDLYRLYTSNKPIAVSGGLPGVGELKEVAVVGNVDLNGGKDGEGEGGDRENGKVVDVITGSMFDLETAVPSYYNKSGGGGNGVERVKEVGVVNFANKRIHIHCIATSFTQEEVLFAIAPEAYISMILIETLADDEIAIMSGMRMISTFSGYLNTFKLEGIIPIPSSKLNPLPLLTQLIMDATENNHTARDVVVRDICKAKFAFQTALENGCSSVVTGGWGTGMFGGNAAHKFLQQILAYSLAYKAVTSNSNKNKNNNTNPKLIYSVFGSEASMKLYRTWLEYMSDELKWNAKELYDGLAMYRRADGAFEKFVEILFKDALRISGNS